jgi:chromosome segregation ATPase
LPCLAWWPPQLAEAEERARAAEERAADIAERLARTEHELRDELKRQQAVAADAGRHREQLEHLRGQLDREVAQGRGLKAAYDGTIEELKEQAAEQERVLAGLRERNEALQTQLDAQAARANELQGELSRRAQLTHPATALTEADGAAEGPARPASGGGAGAGAGASAPRRSPGPAVRPWRWVVAWCCGMRDVYTGPVVD